MLGFEVAYMTMEPCKDDKVPVSYEEAVTSENGETCRKTIDKEVQSLNKNTWGLKQHPPGQKFVKIRWVSLTRRGMANV